MSRSVTEHELHFRVRYAETDQMGFVHHANYLVYFEMGRIELLRASGMDYAAFEKAGYFLVIVNAQVRYRSPGRYDDELVLRTKLERTTAVRIEHTYQLLREGKLLAEGNTTLACVDREGTLQRVPEELVLHDSAGA